jgi:hypothetical protein
MLYTIYNNYVIDCNPKPYTRRQPGKAGKEPEMTTLRTAYIDRVNAGYVARELREMGYDVTRADCTEYAINVLALAAGSDPDKVAEVAAVISSILDIDY